MQRIAMLSNIICHIHIERMPRESAIHRGDQCDVLQSAHALHGR